MVWPGKIRGAEWIALLGLCALLAVPGSALSQTEKTAADGAAAAKAKANVEAATVDIDAEKECVTDDTNAEAQRATNHRNAGFVIASAQMIEDAHTQCDRHWDAVESERLTSMDDTVARLLTWPGPLTGPAHMRIAELDNSLGEQYIRQSLCKEAASANPALCDQIVHPAVKPFCLAWVKIRQGTSASTSICADFAANQQKACKLFFGVDEGACQTAEGGEIMWCSFIQGVKEGSLSNCGAEFQADACIRDILMTTTLERDQPCDSIKRLSEKSGRSTRATTLLEKQCQAISEGKPMDCPPDPNDGLNGARRVRLKALAESFVRGGVDGVIPVVLALPWLWDQVQLAPPDPSDTTGARLTLTSAGQNIGAELRAICTSEVIAATSDGETERQFVASAGTLLRIHRARGTAFTAAVDPFKTGIETHTTCALTAPWIGVEAGR
jgi:hypothetical protein